MRYSEFVYQGAKAASDYGELDASYEAFLLGHLSENEKYASFIDNAVREANSFLQRISVLGKVPARIKTFEAIGNGNPSFEMDADFLRPLSVFQYRDDDHPRDYDVLPFKKLGKYVFVMGPYSPYRKIHIQYRVAIPIYGLSDIPFISEYVTSNGQSHYDVAGDIYDSFYEAKEAAEEADIDLTESFGITDEVLMLGVDWIKARCRDDKSKGHQEEMEVESRLNDVADDEFIYEQRKARSF